MLQTNQILYTELTECQSTSVLVNALVLQNKFSIGLAKFKAVSVLLSTLRNITCRTIRKAFCVLFTITEIVSKASTLPGQRNVFCFTVWLW